jgi:NTE family protein
VSQFDRQPKVGLVLSGGGGRGTAHIGVLKVLARERIPIDFLAGTSMGSVIGAGYASGLSVQEMEAEALRMASLPRLLDLVDRKLPRRGLLAGERVHDYFVGHLGPATTFDDLRIPLALVAVDTISGREVVLRQGLVADAVRASVAIPGLMAPMEMNGYCLIDGGLLNNLPVDVARQAGAEVVIAVDVGGGFDSMPTNWMGHIAGAIQRSWVIALRQLYEYKLQQCPPDVLISLNDCLNANSLTGYTRAAAAIAAGEAATVAALPQIRQAIASHYRKSHGGSLPLKCINGFGAP